MTKNTIEKIVSVEEMVRDGRKSIAIDNYVRFNETEMLDILGIDPKTIKRKGGRPPKYFLQKSEFPNGFSRIVHADRHIVQIVLKQIWQLGIGNTNSKMACNNPCFISTAKLFDCDPREVARKFYRVPKKERYKMRVWLLKILLNEDLVHRSKVKRAQEIINCENS
jgi:hypothetical protein